MIKPYVARLGLLVASLGLAFGPPVAFGQTFMPLVVKDADVAQLTAGTLSLLCPQQLNCVGSTDEVTNNENQANALYPGGKGSDFFELWVHKSEGNSDDRLAGPLAELGANYPEHCQKMSEGLHVVPALVGKFTDGLASMIVCHESRLDGSEGGVGLASSVLLPIEDQVVVVTFGSNLFADWSDEQTYFQESETFYNFASEWQSVLLETLELR